MKKTSTAQSYKTAIQRVRSLTKAALSLWKSVRRDAKKLGAVLAQMQSKLARSGCKGAFSKWLRENRIPRATAYRMIDKSFGRVPKKSRSKKTRKRSGGGKKNSLSLREQVIARLKGRDQGEIVRFLSGIYVELTPWAKKQEVKLQPISGVAMKALGFREFTAAELTEAFADPTVLAAGKTVSQAVSAVVN
jgi:hypothetical protein